MKTNQLNYLRENILEEALCFLAYKNKFKNRKQSLKNFIFGDFWLLKGQNLSTLTKVELRAFCGEGGVEVEVRKTY